MSDQNRLVGLLLSDDLIFTSRVTGTGRGLGLPIRVAKSPDAMLALAYETLPACVIIDLSNPGLKICEHVECLKKLSRPPTVVGYGSHVDTATLKEARDVGCDVVLARSQFVEALPQRLSEWMGRSEPKPK